MKLKTSWKSSYIQQVELLINTQELTYIKKYKSNKQTKTLFSNSYLKYFFRLQRRIEGKIAEKNKKEEKTCSHYDNRTPEQRERDKRYRRWANNAKFRHAEEFDPNNTYLI